MTTSAGPIRLLLIHGSRLNAAAWGPLEEELLGRVVCHHFDLPGHGHRTDEPFTMAAALDAVDEAIASLDTDRQRVVIAGHSLGGYVGMEWAAAHPDTIHGLVLLGATAQPTSRAAGIYRAVSGVLRASLEDARRSESLREADATQLRRIIGEPTARAVIARGPGLAAIPDAWDAVLTGVDLRDLADVDVPVMAINGEFDQFRLGEAFAKSVRGDLRLAHIPGGTHFAPITHPGPVADAITGFLAELP